jgi:hypothetical protein
VDYAAPPGHRWARRVPPLFKDSRWLCVLKRGRLEVTVRRVGRRAEVERIFADGALQPPRNRCEVAQR